jgi:hypothetical protein
MENTKRRVCVASVALIIIETETICKVSSKVAVIAMQCNVTTITNMNVLAVPLVRFLISRNQRIIVCLSILYEAINEAAIMNGNFRTG